MARVAQTFSQRPSALLGIEDLEHAYLVDEALYFKLVRARAAESGEETPMTEVARALSSLGDGPPPAELVAGTPFITGDGSIRYPGKGNA
jgi:hypothetical protein